MPRKPRDTDLPHVRFPCSLGELRRGRRVTQEEVAKDMQVKRHYIAWWESGIALPRSEIYERLQAIFSEGEVYPAWVVDVIRRGSL